MNVTRRPRPYAYQGRHRDQPSPAGRIAECTRHARLLLGLAASGHAVGYDHAQRLLTPAWSGVDISEALRMPGVHAVLTTGLDLTPFSDQPGRASCLMRPKSLGSE
jgi:hypothetical protein